MRPEKRTPEYDAWVEMRRRCRSPGHQNFADYGGRGIGIDPRWDTFAAFFADVGPRPSREYSLGRIDNDGPYAPGNCAWQTREEQMNNTRRSRLVRYRGEVKPLARWCRELALNPRLVGQRLWLGWPVEDAFEEPTNISGRWARAARREELARTERA